MCVNKSVEEINYIHKGKLKARVLEIHKNGKKFLTPTHFPSISSKESNDQQRLSLIQLCTSVHYPRLLISAYDLHHIRNNRKLIIQNLKKYIQDNILFIDSGAFESYWLHDNNWNFTKYKKIITELPSDFYASFDVIPRPDDNVSSISSSVNNYMKRSKSISRESNCMMIIHGNTSSQLIEIVEKNIKNSSMFAISEKECGKTMNDKLKTIQKIRSILSKNDPTNILHILGCGSPLSIGMFSFAGADSFDSINWSRWIIDPNTLQFMDLHLIDLINCKCKFCKNKTLDISTKAFLHNLLFYQQFINKLQIAIINNKDLKFFKKYVTSRIFSKISKVFNT